VEEYRSQGRTEAWCHRTSPHINGFGEEEDSSLNQLDLCLDLVEETQLEIFKKYLSIVVNQIYQNSQTFSVTC